MAEAVPAVPVGNPTSQNSTPVTLNVPGSMSGGAPPAVSQPTSAAQQQAMRFADIKPETLSEEQRHLYNAFVDERKAWETQSKDWETQRSKWSEGEKRLQDLERKLQEYSTVEQSWRQWLPIIHGFNKPGVIEQVLALSRGEALTPKAEQPSQQTLAQRYVQNVADDDFVTAGTINQVLAQLRDQVKQEVLAQAEQGWTKYGQTAGQQLAQQFMGWNNDYYSMADQMFMLKLMHYFGLQPKEGALFDERRIISEAERLGTKDLNLVWNLLYGDERSKRALQDSQTTSQQEMEKIRQEAYQQGLQQGRMASLTNGNPLLNQDGKSTLPAWQPQKTSGYGSAEATLREKLNGLGIRG